MTYSLIDRYRRWFAYEKDMHTEVITSLQSAMPAQQSMPSFQKAVDLFGHMMTARRLWLYRFGVLTEGPKELFPQNVALESLPEVAGEIHSVWTAYLERLNDEELNRIFEYTSIDGYRFQNRIEDILTQLFGHSWYHRGQIAMLIKQGGGIPAVTDFVYWCRESVPNQSL